MRQEEVRPKEPEIEEEDDEEEEEGFLNPKLEKAITIGGIVAALIIIALILYFVGNVFGFFKGAPDKIKDTETEEPSVINTEKEKIEQVKMIDIKGKTVADARIELQKLGLGLYEQGTQASEQYEKGQIMSQDVEEGTDVDIHTTINVYVSTGAGEIKIPNIVGYDSEAAMNMLTDQGFVPNRKYEYSDSVASGKVISQDPAGDTAAKKGDTVTLVVSQGKEAVSVPDVYNRSQEEATNMLSQAGLTVTSTTTEPSDTVPKGNVITQSIPSGKYVDRGTGITLVISSGSNKTYYYCKATISAPESDEVVSADIVLTASNGTQIQTWSGIKISSFPYSITASDIENCDSGTIKVTWHLSDGTSREQTENVMFTKQ